MFGADYETFDEAEENLLRDEDIFEVSEPGEVPELRKDVTIIATLESNARSIQYLLDDIRTTGGMNQSLALEAAQYSAAIKATPIGFYTRDATKTRLSVTVESLWQSLKDSFRRIIDAILEMIRKAVAWFVGLFKKDMNNKDYEKAKQELDIQEESNTKAWESVIDQMAESKISLERFYRYQDYLDKVTELYDLDARALYTLDLQPYVKAPGLVNRVIHDEDPFMYDLIYQGPYSSYINDLGRYITEFSMNIGSTVADVKRIVQEASKGVRDKRYETYTERHLKRDEEPRLYNLTESRNPNSKVNFERMIKEINVLREKTKNLSRAPIKIDFRDLLASLLTQMSIEKVKAQLKNLYNVTRSLVDSEKGIYDIYALIDQIESGDTVDPGNDNLVSRLRALLLSLSVDINNLVIISRYIKSQYDYSYFMIRDINHYIDSALEWIAMQSTHFDDKDVPEELVKVISDLSKKRAKAIQTEKTYKPSK